MAQGFYGSIDVEALFKKYIVQDGSGNKWVNLSAIPDESPFNIGKKNGQLYAGIGVYVNDELDQFNNCAGISLQQSQEQREAKEKRVYIGNLKYAQQPQTAAAQTTAAAPQQKAPPPSFGAPTATAPTHQQPKPPAAENNNLPF